MTEDISCSDSGKRKLSLVGGFLGAGKTTLIGSYTEWLQQQGLRVALVTNDQGEGLLDTASAREALERGSSSSNNDTAPQTSDDEALKRLAKPRSQNSVAEITGGCFCCRLEELVEVISQLEEEERPDMVVAEPVGSCTDLMATVLRPLEQVYQTPFALSPLSVLLDARRALASLGGKRSKRDFHRDVGYIYRKQIEEAEWLVVNKCDLLTKEDLADLLLRLQKDYSDKRLFVVSAKTGEGLEEWFQATLQAETSGGREMEVDYQRYAEGEALLGWVNSEAVCEAQSDIDWKDWLLQLGKRIGEKLNEGNHEVGHFKMSLTEGGNRHRVHQVMGGEELSVITENGTNEVLSPPVLLVNLRAEGDAKALEKIVQQAVAEQSEVEVTFQNQAAFQPGEPVPVHRIAAA